MKTLPLKKAIQAALLVGILLATGVLTLGAQTQPPTFGINGAVPTQAGVLPQAATSYSQEVSDLFVIVFAVLIFFFAVVIGLLLVFIIRFRARKPGEEGARIRGNTKLEIIWTVIPLVIMVVLGALATRLVWTQIDAPKTNTLIVKVTGYQFGWDFAYYEAVSPESVKDAEYVANICGNPSAFVHIRSLNAVSKNELWLPKDRQVRFLLSANDVIHSLWVPQFMIKQDAVPGVVNDMWMIPHEVGTYEAQCAELCGPEHSNMDAKVVIATQADFDAWLAQRTTAPAASVSEASAPASSEI